MLARVGVSIEVVPAEVDESVRAGEEAVPYAARVAADKAAAIAGAHPERWILAADTVVEVDGVLLGKAADAREARSMVARLAGRVHRVTTAFAVRGPGGARADEAVTAEVVFRPLTDAEVHAYIESGEWRGKAGAYAIQGVAAALVSEVRGSITTVIGLPLAEVLTTLAALGGPLADLAAGDPA